MVIQDRLGLLGAWLGVAGACCLPFVGLRASAQSVVAPGVPVGGASQYEWTTRWWTAAGEADNASNPLFSDNGSASLDLINQAGSPVYFLTGAVAGDPSFSDPGPISRTARITSGQHIFFPVFNYLEWKSFDPSFITGADVCGSAQGVIDNAVIDSIHATLDGSSLVSDITSFRQSCDGQPDLASDFSGSDGIFSATTVDGSLFATSFGTAIPDDRFASDGYWLMLAPLAAGTYELNFGGSFYDGGFVQNNTYTLNVYNPTVPGPLPALGVAATFAYSRRLRKRIRSSKLPAVSSAHH